MNEKTKRALSIVDKLVRNSACRNAESFGNDLKKILNELGQYAPEICDRCGSKIEPRTLAEIKDFSKQTFGKLLCIDCMSRHAAEKLRERLNESLEGD